jgi:hypothetical protein
MGGRKSYTLESVVGRTAENAKARQKFVSSVKSKDSTSIVSSALDLFAKSDKLVHNLTEAVQAFEFVRKNAEAPQLDRESRRRLASEYWTKRREETGLPPNPAIDRILVDSIAKYIRRGKRK